MSNGERALYYLGGLVAVFVLAYFLGTAIGPALGVSPDRPATEHSEHP